MSQLQTCGVYNSPRSLFFRYSPDRCISSLSAQNILPCDAASCRTTVLRFSPPWRHAARFHREMRGIETTRRHTHTHPHADKMWGLEQVSQLCLCLCVSAGLRHQIRAFIRLRIICLGRWASFILSATLGFFSILNFWCIVGPDCSVVTSHTHTHSVLQPVLTKLSGSKQNPEEQHGPSWVHFKVWTDYFVNNIRRSKPTVTRKPWIKTQVLLKLKRCCASGRDYGGPRREQKHINYSRCSGRTYKPRANISVKSGGGGVRGKVIIGL